MDTKTSKISVDPQSVSSDIPPGKPFVVPLSPPDPALVELRKISRDVMAIRCQMDKQCQGSKASEEWQMIGLVIDRLLFSLYILFIFVGFITIMSIWIWNNSYSLWLTSGILAGVVQMRVKLQEFHTHISGAYMLYCAMRCLVINFFKECDMIIWILGKFGSYIYQSISCWDHVKSVKSGLRIGKRNF